ncbi:MAG TPA: flagellar motor switch protein FliN [Gammaproteobacteria bacterium]
MSDEAINGNTGSSDGKVQDQKNYDTASFQALHEDNASRTIAESGMDMILDIPVTISVEIGRSKINIRNLLKLNQGSIVELDRLAGEPMDLIVNGTLIAHGEVVVVNEKFGVRLTDVISAAERVKKLK